MESSKLIKALRQSLKLKQSDFAKALNITQQEISKIETGKCSIKIDLLIQISTLFQVPLYLNISENSINIIPRSSLKLIQSFETLHKDDQEIIITLIDRLK